MKRRAVGSPARSRALREELTAALAGSPEAAKARAAVLKGLAELEALESRCGESVADLACDESVALFGELDKLERQLARVVGAWERCPARLRASFPLTEVRELRDSLRRREPSKGGRPRNGSDDWRVREVLIALYRSGIPLPLTRPSERQAEPPAWVQVVHAVRRAYGAPPIADVITPWVSSVVRGFKDGYADGPGIRFLGEVGKPRRK